MIDTPSLSVGEENTPIRNPWPALLFGLGCCTSVLVVAGIWPELNRPDWLAGTRALGVLVGLAAAGFGVSVQPRSALVVFGGATTAFIGNLALDKSWDSARMVVAVLAAMGLAAAFILLLPSAFRRLVVSLFILFHFSAITMAVLTPVPSSTPWIAEQLGTRFYRPYQEFFYLVNAYHYYAPEPGAPNLVWFCVEFEDHSKRWIKVPNRDQDAKDPLSVEFYRMLSIGESASTLGQMFPVLPPDTLRKREVAGNLKGIPFHPALVPYAQYRPTAPIVARLVTSYVRFVARTAQRDNPDQAVTGIKVYRVVHNMLSPGDCAEERDPMDKTLFQPYFLGEYHPDGRIKDAEDAFLHWYIPIFYAPRSEENQRDKDEIRPGRFRSLLPPEHRSVEPDVVLMDYLKVHAASDPWGDQNP